MKFPFGITERACTKDDYAYYASLTKRTLFRYIEMLVPLDMQLLKQGFLDHYQNMMILEKEGKPVGFYAISLHDDFLKIEKLYLEPSLQGKGVGTFFMQYFETLGKDVLRLNVWKTNPAKAFYEKLGYTCIGEEGHEYLMEKRL